MKNKQKTFQIQFKSRVNNTTHNKQNQNQQMQQQQQLVAQSQHQQQQHSQLQISSAQQNGQLLNNSQLAHQHQFQLSSSQHAHQQQQSPSKKERKSQSIMNQQLLQQSNQIPTSISSQGNASSAPGQPPATLGIAVAANGNAAQPPQAHHHAQNPFQGRGYSSFNSSVVGQGGPVIVPNSQSQISSQGGPPGGSANPNAHPNYFIQSSAAATAATMMLNGNTSQPSQMQQANSSASSQHQGQSQQSQYSGQKERSAAGPSQALVQQPSSQLNHQSGYKQVVISNIGKTSGISSMQMQQIGQLNSHLPSEFSQIMQNVVVPAMPSNHGIGVTAGPSHVVPISVSPMPMPPTNAVIIGSGPGHHHQQTSGAILNHHRRKQFRNMPAGNKLEQLQHHSMPQHHQQMVHHGSSYQPTYTQQSSSVGIKQNGLRNSFILNNPGTAAASTNAPGQQQSNEYFNSNMNQQQTPQSQSTTMNSTGQNSANQGNVKIPGQQVYPIKQGKMRQQNEMSQAANSVAQANFNAQLNQQQMIAAQQQFLSTSQNNQRTTTTQVGLAPGAADSSIYKIKSSQNIRLDDDIARDRAFAQNQGSQHVHTHQNETPNQNMQNLQQIQMQINAQSQAASELLVQQQQQQQQIQIQQKMTQSNFFQQQQQQQQIQQQQIQQQQLVQQQQQSSNGNSSAMQGQQQAAQQQQNQTVRGQLLQAQFQKHKQFNQTTTGNLNQMNNSNLAMGSGPSSQSVASGQSAQVSSVRQTNKGYKRRFIVHQGGQQPSNQSQAPPNQMQQHGNNQPSQIANNNLQVPPQQQQNVSQSVQQAQSTLMNSQRAGPSRGGGGPSTYYDDNQSDTKPSQSAQEGHQSQYGGGNKVSININMNHTSQNHSANSSSMNGATGSSYQMGTTNFQQRIINPRDINFHNGGSYAGGSGVAQDYGGLHKNHGVSPNKKSTFNVGGSSGGSNQNNNNNSNNQVERINVTIPNPLLMPNASVQIQYQQELVRNVLQRVDDIFHLKQIVDIKNDKLKDKALASNDQDSTSVFDEVKNREIQRINKENSMLQRFKDARIEDKLLRKQFVKGCRKIALAFKSVVEEDDELEKDLTAAKELLVSEVSCLEIMGEKLTKKQICAMTCKARLIEACLKEKEYDPYFSISLVLGGARNSFMREVGRHVDCYAENVESQNSANLVRRIYKNMTDTHHVRRVKLYKDQKIDKYFKLLITFNEESKKHIVAYKLKFQEAQIRQQNFENFINQEMQRRNRETREGSSLNRHDRDNSSGGGSRVRGSVNRDMTPNKLGKQLQMNSSLSSSDTNIVNIKNHATQNGRNIKTPQSSGQNGGSTGASATNASGQASSSKAEAALQQSGQKPTRLSLRMLSEKNKQKLQQQQQQQLNSQIQTQMRNKGGMMSRKSQQLQNQEMVINNTSRKSLKQLQQLKRSHNKLNGDADQLQGSSLTNGEDSTQISNNNEFYNKARRTTSGGAFNYLGMNGRGPDKGSCVTPPLSIYAMYQADLFDMQHNRPKWYGFYVKLSRNYMFKLRVCMKTRILELTELQSTLNMGLIMNHFWQIQDDMRQRKILTFVLMRNLLRIQNFWKAIKKMRNEAAFKIQRTRRVLKILKSKHLEMEQKIDQLQYRCQLKKIQKWIKGKLKLIKSKRSKVNPAVEQVLRDPERVQNSKMIQEILIPIVLRIQRAIRYWIYRRKYLPYLRLKRQRDKINATHNKVFRQMNYQYQPLVSYDSYKLNKYIGLRLNLKQVPNYFINLQAQASKQLNAEDIQSITKSRVICETKLEQNMVNFKRDMTSISQNMSAQNIINQFYS